MARLEALPVTTATDPASRLLDAAERLLVEVGHAGITTRRLATEAGVNLGLIHYYFGSMEELFLAVLEHFTDRLIERQRAMYAAEAPFIDKWRSAMQYLNEDRPYQKIWWELQAMAWNRPDLQPRIATVHAAWSDAMREAVAGALARYELDRTTFRADEWVTLIVALNEGLILERLSGLDRGHAALLARIDAWLSALERGAARREGRDGCGREGSEAGDGSDTVHTRSEDVYREA